ncbi:SDR family oxidoreductase [Cereibacter azotoformans]|uniref:Short-subunit dehydrogenase n=1 Tax=Cereibacter azotoformans TaxID=43057 RepID=A0A2T5KCD7_9RHOB|nr:SDR family oxidoreductase [Cereibacter azotoformans]AXQ94064.1 SDR family NAD(P)-dependent oxidoreductase [Cereibacter sphaeroides]MBO4168133.1 SDR family oxidoreductase [Cereibacter azotoformans]PTR20070.1 short-subunit dehydrogenase [Cereibacter azotoformans]UIJ29598.1 SDR family oxidoreductase [Cereibacter azotoformans]
MRQRPVVVITGGTAGVGRALARAYARRGWRVAVLARGRAGLTATAAEVARLGGEPLPLRADVAEAGQVFTSAEAVMERWGRIDLWINNAMVTVFGPAERATPEEYARVTSVTYLGTVHGTLAALRHMRPQDGGTILQIGSALAYRSIPLQAAYCAAKAAVRGFTDSLRSELLHDQSRIRLTMAQLPAVDTPQFDWARTHVHGRPQPVPPIHTPEAVAEAVVAAARSAPREIWIGGPSMQAILGTMVAPGWMDRMMARKAWDSQIGPGKARADNLMEPVERDMGAAGRFGDEASDSVLSLSGPTTRTGLAAGGLLLAGAALATAAILARRRDP